MADNPAINTGLGLAIDVAADEIGGIQHQRVKMQVGADGSAEDVHEGNPMPVTMAGFTKAPVLKTGVSGTPALGGVRVVQFSCVTGGMAGTVKIGANDPINIPVNAAYDSPVFEAPYSLVGPTIVFTNTVGYEVWGVSA